MIWEKWRVVLNNFEFNEKNVRSIFLKRFLINSSTFFISWNSRNERELYELFPLIQSALKERRIRITPVFYIERPGVWIRGCREKNHSVDEVSVFFLFKCSVAYVTNNESIGSYHLSFIGLVWLEFPRSIVLNISIHYASYVLIARWVNANLSVFCHMWYNK